MFKQLLEQIRAYDTIILHRHTNPDGDALGSQMGLKHLLRGNFPEKTVYTVGDDAGRYGFMVDEPMDDLPDSAWENALAIVLDSGSASLVSDDRYTKAAATARVDHHIFCGQFAQTEVIDSTYESCGGMIADFARQCGLRLNVKAATALYTGMVTDSGRFRYDSTGSRTHALASFLMEQPIDTAAIYRELYADDFESRRIKAQFTLKVRFTDKMVAYIYTDLQEYKDSGLDSFTISRGMVGTMSDLRGVEVWANFTETEKGVLCELRSSTKNVNPVAVKYGGGGHAKASGCTLPDRETAMALLRDLDKLMED